MYSIELSQMLLERRFGSWFQRSCPDKTACFAKSICLFIESSVSCLCGGLRKPIKWCCVWKKWSIMYFGTRLVQYIVFLICNSPFKKFGMKRFCCPETLHVLYTFCRSKFLNIRFTVKRYERFSMFLFFLLHPPQSSHFLLSPLPVPTHQLLISCLTADVNQEGWRLTHTFFETYQVSQPHLFKLM